MGSCANCTSRTVLFLFLGLLFVAGLGLIAEGGAALGSLWPLPFASKQFATYIVFIGTGGLFLLAALGGMVGALSGRNSWIMCGFGIMIVAQVGIVGAAVLATLSYTDFNKDQTANALSLWKQLIPSVQQSFETTFYCVGWTPAPGSTTPGCSFPFTRFLSNLMLGTLIGTWAATVLSALILGFSWITRNSIRGTKERKQAWVEQSALEKAKIQVGSANLNLITPSNGALGTSVGSAKPMPSGAPELVLPAPTNGALLSPSNIMRPSESTTTLHEESPFGATQAFPSSPLLSQQSYTPTSAYPASPALSYTSYPGHMSALGLQQARPLSTVSVPPTSEDIMLRV